MGCHFLLQCVKVKSENEREVVQSCPTLRNPMDRSLPGSSIHGIFQARVLEWGALAFSKLTFSSVQSLSHVQLFATPWTAAYQAPPSMGFSRQEYWSGCHCFLMTNLDSILKSRDVTLSTKVHLVKATVFPVVMYGCDSCTVAEELIKAEH